MSKKSRGLLGLACVAMLVALARIIFPATIGDQVADFSVGLSAGLMLGVLGTWKDRRVR